jgi:hypothetical protein
MTAPNNALLHNAAIEGFMAGSVRGRSLTAKNSGTPPAIGTADPSYAALASQASAWGAAIDAAVPTDDAASPQPAGTVPISVVDTGVAINPSTDATGGIQFGQVSKVRLLAGLTAAAFEGRYYAQPAPLTTAELASLASTVSGLYLQAAASVVTPTADAYNNSLLAYAVFAGAASASFAGTATAAEESESTPVTVALTLCFALGGSAAFGFDSLVANDASISQANGLPAEPSTAVIAQAQLAEARLAEAIAWAFCEGRPLTSLIPQAVASESGVAAFAEAWANTNAPILAAAYEAFSQNLNLGASPSLNPGLWNEAYCAFIEAQLGGRNFTSTSSTDPGYVAIRSAAVAFANEVDAAVGASDVTGTPVPTGTQFSTASADGSQTVASPANGTVQEGLLGKTGLMFAVCRGVMSGRPLLGTSADTTGSTYSTAAQAAVALYLESCLQLVTP